MKWLKEKIPFKGRKLKGETIDPELLKNLKLFDGEWYLEQNPDVAQANVDPLLHFVNQGFKEGRKPYPSPEQFGTDERTLLKNYKLFDGDWYLAQNPDVAQAEADPLMHYINQGFDEGRRPYPFPGPDQTVASLEGRKDELSREILEQIEKAAQYEPKVACVPQIGMTWRAPFQDFRYYLHKKIKKRLSNFNYDTIICVPWIRVGGADYVTGQLAHSLRRLLPDKRILLLRTATEHFERPDWLPEDLDSIDLSDLLNDCDQLSAEYLLYVVFVGLNPKRIININSHKCWDVFTRFGKRLANFINLYAYLFCWDITAEGVRVGWAEYYPATGGFLSAVFTDSIFLKRELERLYVVPPFLKRKIVPLFTPPASSVAKEAPLSGHSRGLSRRPTVLWAGRLDRQKRFDLVLDIASKMPHVDFLCWGKPLIDDPQVSYKHLPNVVLQPEFRSLDELPWAEAQAWLFTSSWEGMPTIIIEIGLRGVPVVASAVGGVPELINDDTGWPIRSIDDVDAYVAALEEALGNPGLAKERSLKLKHLVQSRHSVENYDAEVQRVLGEEGRHD